MCVFILSTSFVWIFPILRRIQRDMNINGHGSSRTMHAIVGSWWYLNFHGTLSKNPQISNLMKIPAVGAELYHTDRQPDRMKLTIFSVQLRKAPKPHTKKKNPKNVLRMGWIFTPSRSCHTSEVDKALPKRVEASNLVTNMAEEFTWQYLHSEHEISWWTHKLKSRYSTTEIFKKAGTWKSHCLTFTLLTWRIWWAPINASKWQMGYNSAFKGLKWPALDLYIYTQTKSSQTKIMEL